MNLINTASSYLSPYFQANTAFHTVTNGVRLAGQAGEAAYFVKNYNLNDWKRTALTVGLVAIATIDLVQAYTKDALFDTKIAVHGLLADRLHDPRGRTDYPCILVGESLIHTKEHKRSPT